MHPAFSVIFLTTLIGVGQGLFLALFTGESYSAVDILPVQDHSFYVNGIVLALTFMGAGLFAAVFHLGKPSYMFTRAWRGMTQWRTSWLSRELIALPATMGLLFIYGVAHYCEWDVDLLGTGLSGQATIAIGTVTTAAVFGLFLCTGMIYAAVKFLQEWASPLTVINYTLLGGASGFTLATAYSAFAAPDLITFYGGWAIIITLAALVTRGASLYRNAHIKRKSTVKSAIGVRHQKVEQKAMGFMGGSYNTREYTHGKSVGFLKSVKWLFLVLVFLMPLYLLWSGMASQSQGLLVLAFVAQYTGLLFERWFFFAQANHPQNLYYQTV